MRTITRILIALALASTAGHHAEPSCSAAEHRSKHYDIQLECDLDPLETGKLLDSLHDQLSDYFGRAPRQRLRVEIHGSHEQYLEALERANQVYTGGGGVYSPEMKTAWLCVQPSQQYTRQLLLHEATHQFHFLVATGNRQVKAFWYMEGLAEYIGMHNWDGNRLQLGVVPAVTLEDYPAQALALWEEIDWDLAGVMAGRIEVQRPAAWAWVHFLINRDVRKFRRFSAKLDRQADPMRAYVDVFGAVSTRTGEQLKEWIETHQQPWQDVWTAWQPRGASIEGQSGRVGICTLGLPVREFQTEIRPIEGVFKAGVVFGYQNPQEFFILQFWGPRRLTVVQRDGHSWRQIAWRDVPPASGDARLAIRRHEDRTVLSANDRTIFTFQRDTPGKVGLTVDGCTARFAPDVKATHSCRPLAQLLGTQRPSEATGGE